MELVQNFKTYNSLSLQTLFPEAILKETSIKNTSCSTRNDPSLDELLKILQDAIIDEESDEAFYLRMKNQTIQDEDQEILDQIANDEKKHRLLLKQIYFSLTGKNFDESKSKTEIEENTYLTNLKKSLFGELDAIKKYQKLLSKMTDTNNYNKVMEILMDEITHANKLNYLITKYLIHKQECANQK